MYASSALEARPADGEGLIDNELLPAPQPLPCLITIDGTEIEARTGDCILASSRRAGISIPSMCADNSLIGMGAIVLDGAVIACNTIVGAGAVVPGGYSGPEGVLLLGAPAKVVRSLTSAEIDCIRANARTYAALACLYRQDRQELVSLSGKDRTGAP